jgi:hypothetical protein
MKSEENENKLENKILLSTAHDYMWELYLLKVKLGLRLDLDTKQLLEDILEFEKIYQIIDPSEGNLN